MKNIVMVLVVLAGLLVTGLAYQGSLPWQTHKEQKFFVTPGDADRPGRIYLERQIQELLDAGWTIKEQNEVGTLMVR